MYSMYISMGWSSHCELGIRTVCYHFKFTDVSSQVALSTCGLTVLKDCGTVTSIVTHLMCWNAILEHSLNSCAWSTQDRRRCTKIEQLYRIYPSSIYLCGVLTLQISNSTCEDCKNTFYYLTHLRFILLHFCVQFVIDNFE